MKKLLVILMCVALMGCESSTIYGNCIGAFDDKEPNLRYSVSVLNVIVAVIFFETVIVPVVVVAKEAQCPTGKR